MRLVAAVRLVSRDQMRSGFGEKFLDGGSAALGCACESNEAVPEAVATWQCDPETGEVRARPVEDEAAVDSVGGEHAGEAAGLRGEERAAPVSR